MLFSSYILEKLTFSFWHVDKTCQLLSTHIITTYLLCRSTKISFSFRRVGKTQVFLSMYRQNSLSLSDVSAKITEFIRHINKTNLFLSTGKFQHLNLFWKFFFFLSSKKLTKIFRRVEKKFLFLSMCRENSLSSFDTSEKLAKLFQRIDET